MSTAPHELVWVAEIGQPAWKMTGSTSEQWSYPSIARFAIPGGMVARSADQGSRYVPAAADPSSPCLASLDLPGHRRAMIRLLVELAGRELAEGIPEIADQLHRAVQNLTQELAGCSSCGGPNGPCELDCPAADPGSDSRDNRDCETRDPCTSPAPVT